MSKIDSIQISGTVYEIQDSGATKVVNVTQAEYESLVSGGTVDPTVLYNITDAQAADLSQYWTSAQTNSAITAAVSGKQDTLSAGTGIDITDNVISATGGGGGGKAVEAGRGISVASGDSAYTVSFNMQIGPIGADSMAMFGYPFGTGGTNDNTVNDAFKNLLIGNNNNVSHYSSNYKTYYNFLVGMSNSIENTGYTTSFNGFNAIIGGENKLSGKTNSYSYLFGLSHRGYNSWEFIAGYSNIAKNKFETAFGQNNNSVSASTSFGNSGNTLFSVGNGTSNNARHNAFEIRQNGDIYITLNGQDVKLQDNLGGGEVSSAITSGDTNAVAGGAVYDKFDEVEQVTAAALNNLNDRLSEVNDTIGDINTILQSI